MKHKITDRQLTALLAIYFGQGPYMDTDGLYGPAHEKAGTPVWRHRTNMGGAIRLMADRLREGGFVTDWGHHSERHKPYYETGSQLTVKGFEAIEERLGKLPKVKNRYTSDGDTVFDFNEAVKPDELTASKQARARREAEIERLRKEERDQNRREMAAHAERYAAEKLAKLRELFTERGLADNWSDDELIAFAERIASL